MSPNGTSYNFDEILIFSSSESSDSESLLQEDLKSNGDKISKQWEAIERTLYQEPGEHVTDPELVKECKLWRETFPHFRVTGSKVDIKVPESEDLETDKDTQTLKKHFDLKKLEEKRESIKNKVVGMLVNRLIAKYGPSENKSGIQKNNAKITETRTEEKSSDAPQKNNIIKPVNNYESRNRTEEESYFERGKPEIRNGSDPEEDLENYITREQAEKSLHDIFDSWEKDCKSATKLPKACLKGEPKKSANARDDFSDISNPPKPQPGRFKPKKLPPPVPISDLIKPYEMTKKIDKKYEGLLERIMERRYKDTGVTRHCPTSASGTEFKSYQESLEKLRIGDGFNDCMKRNTMPRINKLNNNNNNNNWLKRREINRLYEEDDILPKNTQSVKLNRHSNLNLYNENDQVKTDEKYLEDLKKEMRLNYKRPPKKSVLIDEINLQRPKLLKPVERPSKSLSCMDFQMKSKKETKIKWPKNGPETSKNEANLKSRSNMPNKKGSNTNSNQNPILPPIECGLICTEITGRPKIAAKIPPKRR